MVGSFDPDRSYRSARLAAAALRWHSAPFAVSDNDNPRKPNPRRLQEFPGPQDREGKSASASHVINVSLLSYYLFALCHFHRSAQHLTVRFIPLSAIISRYPLDRSTRCCWLARLIMRNYYSEHSNLIIWGTLEIIDSFKLCHVSLCNNAAINLNIFIEQTSSLSIYIFIFSRYIHNFINIRFFFFFICIRSFFQI